MYEYIQTSLGQLSHCETITACMDFYLRWCDSLRRLECFSHNDIEFGKQVMGNYVDKKINKIVDKQNVDGNILTELKERRTY